MDRILIKIKNKKHLSKLIRSFDKKYNTQTHVFQATIADVDKTFLDNIYTEEPIYFIDELFDRYNDFTTAHPDIVEDWKKPILERNTQELGFITSIYFLQQAYNTVGFYHPINIHRFDTGLFSVHPGTTRMRFGKKYDKPMTFILTDYTGKNFQQEYPQFNSLPIEMFNIDYLEDLYYKEEDLSAGTPKTLLKASKKNVVWKCCTSNWAEAGDPTTNNPPIHFLRKDNIIYVNGVETLQKDNEGFWRVY